MRRGISVTERVLCERASEVSLKIGHLLPGGSLRKAHLFNYPFVVYDRHSVM